MTVQTLVEMCDHSLAIRNAVRSGDMQRVYAAATALQRLALANGAQEPEAEGWSAWSAERASWTPDKEAQAKRIADAAKIEAEDASEEARR